MLNRLLELTQIQIPIEEAFNQLREPIPIEIPNPLHEPEVITLELEVAVVLQEVAETTFLLQAQGVIQITPHLRALAQVRQP